MVSIVIPTYNREKVIVNSISSVLDQSYQDIELIVVDDGSTDNTEGVIRNISDPRVRYIRQNNQGACAARNLGITESKGEYVAFQDSDDVWKPDKLQKQMQIMIDHPEVDIVSCKTICERIGGTSFISLNNQPGGILTRETGPYGISTQTLLVRKRVFERTLFDTNVTRYQDLDFMLCAMKNGFSVFVVPEILVERHHEANSISNHPERIYSMTQYFQKKHPDVMNNNKQLLSKFLCNMLIESSADMKISDRRKYHKLAYSICKGPKTIIKILLSIVGIHISGR